MTVQHFPILDPFSVSETKDALHAYSRVLGAWLKTCRPARKHWWHASLRPSLSGITTGVIHAGVDIELEIDLGESLLSGRTSNGEQLSERLVGQPANVLSAIVREFMIAAGTDRSCIPPETDYGNGGFAAYSTEQAYKLGRSINAVSAALDVLRAGIREETGPIQLWPHHFDLSMLWLPGEKIPGQDPANEEYSDKQMNFGFTFGDAAIQEPYFYITAYPLPDAFPSMALPAGTAWQSEGFSGAVLCYRTLMKYDDPKAYLIDLWTQLLSAGREQMLEIRI
jgi:hypothetical protein